MEPNVEPIKQWLESQLDRSLHIRKEENGDLDDVMLHLEKVVSAVRNDSHPDDYISKHSLILQGKGIITNQEGEAEIPQNLYEIPYDDQIRSEKKGTGLKIMTERAVYELSPE